MFEPPFTDFHFTPSPSSHMKDIERLVTHSIYEIKKSQRYRNSYEDMTHSYLRHKQKRMSLTERIERNKRRKHQLSQLTESEKELIRKYTNPSLRKFLEPSFTP